MLYSDRHDEQMNQAPPIDNQVESYNWDHVGDTKYYIASSVTWHDVTLYWLDNEFRYWCEIVMGKKKQFII